MSQNDAKAVKWYRKAAEQNNAPAQFGLGVCYELGRGIQKDVVEAYKWYSLAATQGFYYATTNRDNLEKQMTPNQIAQAKKLVIEFQISHAKKSLNDHDA